MNYRSSAHLNKKNLWRYKFSKTCFCFRKGNNEMSKNVLDSMPIHRSEVARYARTVLLLFRQWCAWSRIAIHFLLELLPFFSPRSSIPFLSVPFQFEFGQIVYWFGIPRTGWGFIRLLVGRSGCLPGWRYPVQRDLHPGSYDLHFNSARLRHHCHHCCQTTTQT